MSYIFQMSTCNYLRFWTALKELVEKKDDRKKSNASSRGCGFDSSWSCDVGTIFH